MNTPLDRLSDIAALLAAPADDDELLGSVLRVLGEGLGLP